MTENTTERVTTFGASGMRVHKGTASRYAGSVVTACNGRTTSGVVGAAATTDRCKRCFRDGSR